MTLVSENVLVDTIYALGLMICFYYSLTAFACAWYFRNELCRSGRDLVFKGVFPVLGGVLLTAVFGKTLYDMWDPAYGSRLLGPRRRLGLRHRRRPAAARRGHHAGDAAPQPGVLPRRGADEGDAVAGGRRLKPRT